MPFEHSFQAQTDLVRDHFINTPLQKVLLEGLHGIEGHTSDTTHCSRCAHVGGCRPSKNMDDRGMR